MNLYVKNTGSVQIKWGGQFVQPNSIYMIEQEELNKWKEDLALMTDIINGVALISRDGINFISDANEAINTIKGIGPSEVIIATAVTSQAFAQKYLADGRSLFRRKHGKRGQCPVGPNIIDFTVPYASCKIDEVEIVGCDNIDNIDLIVLDTVDGLIQQSLGIPAESISSSFPLNQFGFDVCLSDMYFSDSSNYDADLIGGMRIRVVYKNNGSIEKNIGVNFVLHEVV